MSIQLDEEQTQRIESHFEQFRKFLETEEAKSWKQERHDRTQLYARLLNPDAVERLTEIELGQILEGLWANAGWTNKTYVADRVLKTNELSHLKSELRNLLWGDEPLEQRYDEFMKTVKGLGPASVTEIMAFVHPAQCGLWNDRTREAIRVVGLDKRTPPPDKYKISGREYVQFNRVLAAIRDLMKERGFPNPTIIDVDFLLYFIVTTVPGEPPEHKREDYEFDHDEVVDVLVQIGTGLGFDAESGKLIAKGAKVDAIWTAKIANLGTITYVFEVQKSGSVDSLILNLQKAKNNPTVQKLVVVANGRAIADVREEVATLSEDFRRSLAFIEANEILRAAKLLGEFNTILEKLELFKGQF